MKKLLIAIALFGLNAQSATAASYRCSDEKTVLANFALSPVGSTVNLVVHSEGTKNQSYTGVCSSEEGAIELSLICQIMVSTDVRYEVRLYSIGGPDLFGSVTRWTMEGQGQQKHLPCRKTR
jgi:hypothetical protein